ncbi:MAG: ECF transporter S component [Fervidobacterium sp.]
MKKTATRIAIIGIMSALATGLMFLEFPIFPSIGFLKYDPSDILPILAGFIFGPTEGILILAIKDILFYLLKSGDIVGIAMNFVAGISYLLPTVLIYRWRKNRVVEVIAYTVGVIVATGVMSLLNMVVVPLYWKIPFNDTLKWIPWIAGFNAIKFSIDSVINALVRERVSRIFEN